MDERNPSSMVSPISTITSDLPMNEYQSTIRPHIHLMKNFILIWLDSNINHSDNGYSHYITQLKCFINEINIFVDVDQCVDYLTDVKHETIFMVVSSTINERVIPFIHEIPQLHSVYIFGEQKWMNEWTKVKGSFTQMKPIYDLLIHDILILDQISIPISIISQDDSSKKALNELEPSFMYSQLLKETLGDIKYDAHAKEELVQLWRKDYSGNEAMLRIINEFDKTYNADSAISWYTRECFAYAMLNRALRTMNIEIIIKMGFFLSDVHRQIQRFHTSKPSFQSKFTVYRGQAMSNSELKKLRENKGGFVSFNNFLSTSTDPNVSAIFFPNPSQTSDVAAVLFEMEIDPSVTCTPFTSVQEVSHFGNSEKEILFSMNTVFRIGETMKTAQGFWQVRLILTSDNDEQLNILTEKMREETLTTTGWFRLGHLMIIMGQLNKAEEIYQILLNSTSPHDSDQLAHINHMLGYIEIEKGDFRKAYSFFQKSLQIKQNYLPSDHPSMASLYSNIGTVHEKMRDHKAALLFYQKTLEIEEKRLPTCQSSLATTYSNIGVVYRNMGLYSNALSFYQKAFEIQQQYLPETDPLLATTYNNIGGTYESMGDYSNALHFYQKTLRTRQRSLLHDHLMMATIYNCLGAMHVRKGNYSEALKFFEETLKIRKETLPPNHPHLATTCNNIGELYNHTGDYSTASKFYEDALEILQKSPYIDQPLLATIYNNMGALCANKKQHPAALSYFKMEKKILKRNLPSNHPLLVGLYNNMGGQYMSMGQDWTALWFYQKALQILKTSPNTLELAFVYNNMSAVYTYWRKFSNALLMMDKVLEIRQGLLGPNHSLIAMTYSNIGTLHYYQGHYHTALPYFNRALKIGQSCLPENHPNLKTYHEQVDACTSQLNMTKRI